MMTNVLTHGTAAWFEMVGVLMCEAASRARLPGDYNVSVMERYTDGVELPNGLIQGLHFEINRGKPTFRVGARQDERAEITIEITVAAARELNTLYSADPNYQNALNNFLSTGAMRVDGDSTRLGGWMSAVHDAIVERTSS